MDPQIHMHTCAPSQNTLQGQKTTKNIQLLKFAKGWDALNYLTEMEDFTDWNMDRVLLVIGNLYESWKYFLRI